MDSPLFRVLQPGLWTTVQDLGHGGRQRYGVPVGGAVDASSLRLANALVRNPADAPVLEITLTGPVLQLLSDALLAIVGADIPIAVDGAPVPNGHSFRAQAGSLLTFGRRRSGARAYLAAAGGIEPHGSVRLAKEDMITRRSAPPDDVHRRLLHLAPAELSLFESPAVLRAVEGPQWCRFSDYGRRVFVEDEFAVELDSNRIGIRLSGPPLEFASGEVAGIVSEPAPLGTVQVPESGQPIILMADRPTTCGYAKIATVISADIPRAAQLAPRDIVRFRIVELEEAISAAAALENRLRVIGQVATWSG